jgi:hypothetical protein
MSDLDEFGTDIEEAIAELLAAARAESPREAAPARG